LAASFKVVGQICALERSPPLFLLWRLTRPNSDTHRRHFFHTSPFAHALAFAARALAFTRRRNDSDEVNGREHR